jgi:6-phosphofructokinase 2
MPALKTPIVTVTLNPAVDLSSDAEEVVPIHKVRTTNDSFSPGGGGVNVARVITELGGSVLAVALAGGPLGTLLDDLLGKEGVDRQVIRTTAHTRLDHVVHERKTGREYRFVAAGEPVSPAAIEACLAALRGLDFRYLVASGSLPPNASADVLVQIGEIAAEKNAKFVLDTSGEPLRQTLGRTKVHLVKPSHSEMQALVGRKLGDDQALKAAAAELVRRGLAEIVALTLGANGAILATADRVVRMPAADVIAKSAVGAGDSFVAGMTLSLCNGAMPEEAFRYGMAAGAAAALHPGPRLCRKADVERIFAEMSGAQKG